MGFVFGLWIGLILGAISGALGMRQLVLTGLKNYMDEEEKRITRKTTRYYDYYKDREIL